jgi:putative ABC transport system permease protein
MTGVSIGVAACMLISIYVFHEISYDSQVPDVSRIFRLYLIDNREAKVRMGLSFSANTAPTLKRDFPEIEIAGRMMDNPLFYGAGSNEIRIEGDAMQHHEEGFVYTDQEILDIFQLPMVYGDVRSALKEPNTIVIAESKAEQYFKNANPLGKVIYLNGNDSIPFKITGVMKDFPSNSHLDYKFLITLKGVEFGKGEQTRWLQSNYIVYLKMKERVDPVVFEKRAGNTLMSKYMIPALKDAGFPGADSIGKKISFAMQPLRDIQLYSSNFGERKGRGDIRFIWLFGAVAIFILVIACINFVNLSTAQSANRAKEVGLRKAVGSQRFELIRQFLTESILITMISFVIGIGLAYLLLPLFNSVAGKELLFPWSVSWFFPAVVGLALVIGAIAGMYPAFYLSRFNPTEVLKGKLRIGSRSSGLRSTLVVFQFTVSIILIVGTIIINKQMRFILTEKLGFDRNQVIQLYGTNMLGDKVQSFRSEIKEIAGVSSASVSDFLPIDGTKRNGNTFNHEGMEKQEAGIPGQAWDVDEEYLQTIGLKLVAGRNFSKDITTDRQCTIINESMAQKLGMKNAVGQKLSRYGTLYQIIGVVKDFNFRTLQQKIEPICLFYNNSPSIISVKTNSADMPKLLTALEAKWKAFAPNLAFRYNFMDESYSRMYADVRRVETIFTSFAILAIFVACLGLYALSAFMVEQRSKEMSIRKVLGASMQNIFQLLTNHFLGLVAISIVIATPLAYYMMQKWLEDFVYKTAIEWWVFAVTVLVAFLITLITISYHAIRATIRNPVIALKAE